LFIFEKNQNLYMKRIAIFCGASLGFNPIYAQQAAALGRFLAEQQVEIVYGGGKFGMMGTLADAALAAGGKVIGVIPEFLKTEEIAHKGIHDMVTTQQMSTRKVAISKMVDGYIALAGGYGTLDEVMEVLALGQLHIEQKPVAFLNTNDFFNPLLDQFDVMVKEGFLKPENRAMVIVNEDIKALWHDMQTYKAPTVSKIVDTVASK
jgi:uncharacterized protein (TIGR00730 family)